MYPNNKNTGLLTGFTLIEILVYIGVLVIIISSVFSFLLWSIRANAKSKAMREALDNARRAMETMTYEIKEAKSVYTPITTSGQLSLEATRYLPADETATFIDFYLCGTRLCLKKESQNPIAITSEKVTVSSLVFTRVATGQISSVQIDLTIDFPNAKPEYSASVNLKSSTSLRSYSEQ